METNNTENLIKILKRKGIAFDRGETNLFRGYDYYQVINGYKSLFIDSVETIDDIYNNINLKIDLNRYRKEFNISNTVLDSELFKNIAKKIIIKYGLYYSNNMNSKKMLSVIRNITYIHHRYQPLTKYRDFVRMYKFEHELRNLLLKYTLIIEENMKNIFISTLNEFDVSANFLTDINNYNMKDANSNNALETLKIIIAAHGNKHSNPIKRKRQQNITIPYWILINELTMNQTYQAIDNLDTKYERTIFEKCTNYFTLLDLDYKHAKYPNKMNVKYNIRKFKILLNYIGKFRNMLAHNQPIFCYNVDNCDSGLYPKIFYENPKTKCDDFSEHLKNQKAMNATLMKDISTFFGKDKYNSRSTNVNIDLSWIVYVIYKIIIHIDNNSNFYSDLKNVFTKYNVILSEYKYNVENLDDLNKMKEEIELMQSMELGYEEIVSLIENKRTYKHKLKSFNSKFKSSKKTLNSLSKKVSIEKIGSKYSTFPQNARFCKYTGIDRVYFEKIK